MLRNLMFTSAIFSNSNHNMKLMIGNEIFTVLRGYIISVTNGACDMACLSFVITRYSQHKILTLYISIILNNPRAGTFKNQTNKCEFTYRGPDKSLARPTEIKQIERSSFFVRR